MNQIISVNKNYLETKTKHKALKNYDEYSNVYSIFKIIIFRYEIKPLIRNPKPQSQTKRNER